MMLINLFYASVQSTVIKCVGTFTFVHVGLFIGANQWVFFVSHKPLLTTNRSVKENIILLYWHDVCTPTLSQTNSFSVLKARCSFRG